MRYATVGVACVAVLGMTACSPPADRSATLIVSTGLSVGAVRVGVSPYRPMTRTKIQAVGRDRHVYTAITSQGGVATFHLAPGTYHLRLLPGPNQLCG